MSMLLSIVYLKRSYSWQSYISVFLVTLGVMVATIGSIPPTIFAPSFLGLLFLLLSLVLGAFLGLYQEQTYLHYPSTWQSSLFYSHLLALPSFFLVSMPLLSQVQQFSNSSETWLKGVPDAWILLMINTASQYVCIASVHKLASISTSLTTTLILTLRKCISLAISVVYFNNPFDTSHFIGAALVSLGTLLYVKTLKRERKLKQG
ncbi:hypothetical protein HMI54_002146 [Coelomomyces lativittatus]|nr:hypothetical protein HMI54_002146 [Coelomomyces lativittatus]